MGDWISTSHLIRHCWSIIDIFHHYIIGLAWYTYVAGCHCIVKLSNRRSTWNIYTSANFPSIYKSWKGVPLVKKNHQVFLPAFLFLMLTTFVRSTIMLHPSHSSIIPVLFTCLKLEANGASSYVCFLFQRWVGTLGDSGIHFNRLNTIGRLGVMHISSMHAWNP